MLSEDRELELLDWCAGLSTFKKEPAKKGQHDAQPIFQAGERAYDSLRGLELFLRRDNTESQPAFLRLGQLQTVRTQLLPLLLLECHDRAITYHCIRVLVRLTMPLSPLVENRFERLEHLQQYKSFFLQDGVFETIMFIASSALEVHPAARSDEQRNLLELILTLIRNLLAIPDPTSGSEYHKKLHDRCILAMHDALVLETLCVLCTTLEDDSDASIKYLLQDCFTHLLRQETQSVSDLFLSEEDELKLKKLVEERASKSKAGGGVGPGNNGSAITALTKDVYESDVSSKAFASSERARLEAKLIEVARAERASLSESYRPNSRHSRFQGNYMVRVMADPKMAVASSKVVMGADGLPTRVGTGVDESLFGQRLARRPLESGVGVSVAGNRLITDSLAKHHGRKPVLSSTHSRTFFSPLVKRALWITISKLLDGGGFNNLVRVMLHELQSSATKDIVLSEDAKNWMNLNATVMEFARIRSKRMVRAGEKAQRTREKEETEKQRIEHEREERLKKEEREALERQKAQERMMYGLAENNPTLSEISAEGSGSIVPPPIFPDRINSHGMMAALTQGKEHADDGHEGATATNQQQQQQRGGIADLDDGEIDPSLLPLSATASSSNNAASNSNPNSSSSQKKPWIRELTFDNSCVGACVTFDCWKYLLGRIKLYTEDRPIPFKHLEASVMMYTNLVRHLYEMSNYGSVALQMRADSLRRTMFYDRDSLELFASLLAEYKPSNLPRSYLANLIAGVHYQMKMLEEMSRGRGFIVLEKKKKVVRRKKDKGIKIDIKDPNVREQTTKAPTPTTMKKETAGTEDEEMEPGAPTLTEEGDEGARNSLFPAGDGEEEEEGDKSSSPDRPFNPQSADEENDAALAAAAQMIENEDDDDDEYEDVEIEEEESRFVRRESEFEFQRFLMRFANAHVISNYLHCLTTYKENGQELNHMIYVFFHRLTKAHLAAFFFQLSAFVLFERILTDPWVKAQREMDPLRGWIKGIVRTFIDLAVGKKPKKNDTPPKDGAKQQLTETQVIVEGEYKSNEAPTAGGDHMQHEGDAAAQGRDAAEPNPSEGAPRPHMWSELLFWKNMATADRLLNEHGWFDSSDARRARHAHDAEAGAEDNGDEEEHAWIDIDEEEEEAKAELRQRQQAIAEAGEEEELSVGEWVNVEGVRVRAKPWTKQEDELLRTQYAAFKHVDEWLDILVSMLPLRSHTAIKARLKFLGALEKKTRQARDLSSSSVFASGSKKSSGGMNKKRAGIYKPTVTLAEMLDRHEIYKRAPSMDDDDSLVQQIRDCTLEIIHQDCRSSVGLFVEALRSARGDRQGLLDGAGVDESNLTYDPFSFEANTSKGWDAACLENISTLCILIGLPDQDGKEDAWIVPPHFSPSALTGFIDLLESTLESPAAHADAPNSDDEEADEDVERLLAHSAAVMDEHSERQLSKEERRAAKRAKKEAKKEAKRLKREARERAELEDLVRNAESFEAQPSQSSSSSARKHGEEAVLERLHRERQYESERRARASAANDALEEEYQPASSTALGEGAVEAAKKGERNLIGNFARKELDEFMERKRKRAQEAFIKPSSTSTSPSSRGADEGEPSPPKKSKTKGSDEEGQSPQQGSKPKRRLRKAAVLDSDEDEDTAPAPSLIEGQEEQVEGAPTDDVDMAINTDDADAVVINDTAEAADDEDAPARKKKATKARRIMMDDDDDDDDAAAPAGLEAETATPMETTDATAMETDAPATDALTETQALTEAQ